MSRTLYFDNAATTYPKPTDVYNAMNDFYMNNGVNVGRGQYSLASKASALVNETRELIYKLFNCPANKKVVFTSSATEAINIILQGLPWQGEENVYITHFEHNGVLRCLNHLREVHNIDLSNENYLEVDRDTLCYDLEEIQNQFNRKKPNVVIINHASNVCGLVAPIEEISRLAKKYGATVIVDCAQTAGLLNIDLRKIMADYVIFAGHKTIYGPFGIAGFIIDEKSQLKPLLYGGTGIDSANLDMPTTIPERFEVGSPNIQAIAGLNAALKWLFSTGVNNIYEKEREMTNELISVLKEFEVNMYLPSDEANHIGIVSCTFKDLPTDGIGNFLNQHNVAVRTGLHCAPDAHRFLGTYPGGTVRFSLSYFNTNDQLTLLKEIIRDIYLY